MLPQPKGKDVFLPCSLPEPHRKTAVLGRRMKNWQNSSQRTAGHRAVLLGHGGTVGRAPVSFDQMTSLVTESNWITTGHADLHQGLARSYGAAFVHQQRCLTKKNTAGMGRAAADPTKPATTAQKWSWEGARGHHHHQAWHEPGRGSRGAAGCPARSRGACSAGSTTKSSREQAGSHGGLQLKLELGTNVPALSHFPSG